MRRNISQTHHSKGIGEERKKELHFSTVGDHSNSFMFLSLHLLRKTNANKNKITNNRKNSHTYHEQYILP